MKIASIFLFTLLVIANGAEAQFKKILVGKVMDGFTKEPIPFATAIWSLSKNGAVADSAGNIKILRSNIPNDSLVISYVGYQPTKFGIANFKKDTVKLFLDFYNTNTEAVVKSKFNKGLRWWKLVVSHKEENNP